MKLLLREDAHLIVNRSRPLTFKPEFRNYQDEVRFLEGKMIDVETNSIFKDQFNTDKLRIYQNCCLDIIDDIRSKYKQCQCCNQKVSIKFKPKTCFKCKKLKDFKYFRNIFKTAGFFKPLNTGVKGYGIKGIIVYSSYSYDIQYRRGVIGVKELSELLRKFKTLESIHFHKRLDNSGNCIMTGLQANHTNWRIKLEFNYKNYDFMTSFVLARRGLKRFENVEIIRTSTKNILREESKQAKQVFFKFFNGRKLFMTDEIEGYYTIQYQDTKLHIELNMGRMSEKLRYGTSGTNSQVPSYRIAILQEDSSGNITEPEELNKTFWSKAHAMAYITELEN